MFEDEGTATIKLQPSSLDPFQSCDSDSLTPPFSPEAECVYTSVRSAVSFADRDSPQGLAEHVEIQSDDDYEDSDSDGLLNPTNGSSQGDLSSSQASIKLRPVVYARKMSILKMMDSDIQDCIKDEDKFMKIACDIAEQGLHTDRHSPQVSPLRRSLSRLSRQSIRSMSSLDKTKFSSLQSTQVIAALNIHVTSGYVCDYLERLRTRAENVKSAYLNELGIMLGPRQIALRSRSASEGINSLGLGPSLYNECIDFLSQEKAIDALLRDVTLFWKCNGHPDWNSCGIEALTSRIKDILGFTRQSACLNNEVTNWLTCKRLLANGRKKERIRFGGVVERFDRLQEFWAHVHVDARKTDNLLRSPLPSRPSTKESCMGPSPSPVHGQNGRHVQISSLPALTVSDAESFSRPASRLSGSRRSCEKLLLPDVLRSSAKETQGMAIPGQRPDSKCWKTRASRSRCTYGLRPVWPKDPTPMCSAATSSRVSTAATTERPTSSKGWGYWLDETEGKERTSYQRRRSSCSSNKAHLGKWRSQGEDLPLFMKPKHMSIPKSKSLPLLRTNSLHPTSPSAASFCTLSDIASCAQTLEETSQVRSAFVEPWQNDVPNMDHLNSPPKQYLKACQGNMTNPKLLPFVTGHSPKLDAFEEGLFDRDLEAVTEVARHVLIEEVELQGNSMLTEKSLWPFFAILGGTPLLSLNLQRVVHVGKAICMERVVALLRDEEPTGLSRLLSLDLSSIPIAFQWHLPLCKAISGHPSLNDVHLADVGLGNANPKESVGALLGSNTIRALNIGWNCFSIEVLTFLGAGVLANSALRSLNLANCSSSMAFGGISPVLFFAEFLANDQRLRHLDISLNRIDYRGALIIEEALTNHRELTDLVISNNPLGELGMRSLLRLLAQDQSGLQNFVCDGCFAGTYPPADERHPIFIATNPDGKYDLDLAQPYCRALLRMLYKTCDRFELSPSLCFKHVAFKGVGGYRHPDKDAHGFRSLPDRGRLVLTFTIEKVVDGALLRDVREDDFHSFLQLHNNTMRLSPGFKKVVPMFAQWRKLNSLAQEQTIFANALSKDFALTYSHIRCLCEDSGGASADIVWQLLPCVAEASGQVYLITQLAPTLGDFVVLLQKAHIFLHMNVQNPTGHYKLDLENVTCYAVAERLMLIDRWETSIASKHGVVDTSQKGNRSQVRNEIYQGHALTCDMSEWTLPNYDVLEFDYASTKRAPLDAAVLDKVTLTNMMVVMQQSEMPGYMMAEALRKISHHLYLVSLQLREILGIFRERKLICNVCVMFINRVVDMWNEKVFRVRFEDSEFLRICNQVGFCSLFPFIQPEQINLVLDFKYHDQRLAANILIQLANKERIQNLIDLEMLDRETLPVDLRIKSWETFDKMPLSGVFKASYRCAPEDRKLAFRQELFERYGFWKKSSDMEVLWWADDAHVPTDVVLFLCFLARRFHSAYAAYHFMLCEDEDGEVQTPRAKGQINLRLFEDKLRDLKFKKFKGDRVTAVFRYLDSSHEGLVSEKEFGVLDLMWKEVDLCVSEYTKFLERTLGDDYEEIWRFFDEDRSGFIEYDEWMDTAKQLGYFGPVEHIFYFMDEDGNGKISENEFTMLKRMKLKPIDVFSAQFSTYKRKQSAL